MFNIVTGAAGYLGSAMSSYLVQRGLPLRCVEKSRCGDKNALPLDIATDEAIDLLEQSLSHPAVCYHLAGLFVKDYNKNRAFGWNAYFRENVLATRNMARFANRQRCSFVFASSLLTSIGHNDTDDYARSKAEGEQEIICLEGLEYRICRLARVIGIYEANAEFPFVLSGTLLDRLKTLLNNRVIPFDIVSDFLRQGLDLVQGSGHIRINNTERQRSYMHIGDCVLTLEKAAGMPVGTYEVCPCSPITLRRIGEIVLDELDKIGISCHLDIGHDDARDVIGPTRLPKIMIDNAIDSSETLIRRVCREYLKLLQ